MNSDFIILNKTSQTIEYITNILVNFPNKEHILKQNIERDCYNIIENLYAYNLNETPRIRAKYLKDYLVKLAMLNYYCLTAYRRKYISKKQARVISNACFNLKKMTLSLLKGIGVNEV